jgi:hypothetical protein
MGELLGETAKKELAKAGLKVDVVIPVCSLQRLKIELMITGPRYVPSCSLAAGSVPRDPIPRGVCEEQICRADLHHARSG